MEAEYVEKDENMDIIYDKYSKMNRKRHPSEILCALCNLN